MLSPYFWRDRLRASGIHLSISLMLAALAASLVFGVWYPYPYRELSGGRELFLIVVTVDVVLGPLVTLAVFNRAKPRAELRRDLAVVGVLQLAALAYGLWTMAVARPVHLTFEIDRFRVVHAVDVPPELLERTPADIVALPWTGPTLLAVRPFRDANEQGEATMLALQGVQLGARPDLWQPYTAARQRVLEAAKPTAELKQRFVEHAAEIDALAARFGRQGKALVYLPVVGRKLFWTALLDPVTAELVGFLPLDSF